MNIKKGISMYLSTAVRNYINNNSIIIYDNNGSKVNFDIIQKEYSSIKNYLLSNYNNTEVLGVYLKKDYRYLLVILASIEIGLTYVPMNDNWPLSRVRQIESIAPIKKTIDDDMLSKILKMKILYKGKDTLEKIGSQHPLYIIFTSGSTGEPKGVVIKRESVESFFKWCDQYFKDITSTDNLLQIADFSFDMSVLDVGLLLTKHLNIFFSKFNGNIFELAHEIEQYHITMVSTVPNNINMLLTDGVFERVSLEGLRNIFIGGARFSYGLYQKLLSKTTMNVYNFYGPTEVTVYALVKKISRIENNDTENCNVSIGDTISNVKVKLININDNESELYLGGIQVMKEYVSNPTRTAEALIEIDGETYYKTGDIATIDHKGEYYIVGRLDDTIKRRGFRINLQDIDSYIHKIESVIECATISISNEMHENEIVTFLQLKDNDLLNVKREFKNILTTYQTPDKIFAIENFPINNSGKICKKTLKEIYLNSKGAEQNVR